VRIKALEKLSSASGFNKFFLCNSGAESIETALKLARISTKKTGFICAMNGFHGRTMGAVSLTFKLKYREPFAPLMEPVKRVRFGDASQIREAIDENTSAVVLECIQGEGGVRVSPPEYLKEVREICTEKDVLLILDEIQTGFGRTGKMFAFENFGIRPDILCMAKSMAGGLAMGATASRDDLIFPPLAHGSTFGGNPVACAGAVAAISAIEEEGMLSNATENGAYFLSRLKELAETKKQVREVRGMGLMLAVELKVPTKDALMGLFAKKVLVLPGGLQVLRFLPPLVINKEEIDIAINALNEVLE
jgi:acetylornithine/succinyldiaminopimelate/putrescine aminotransferase